MGSGTPGCHSGLQGQRAPGVGLRARGATATSSAWAFGQGLSQLLRGRPFFPRHFSISLFLCLSLFVPSEEVWGEGRTRPRTLSLVTICFGSRVLSHQLFIDSGHRFPLFRCMGSGPQGQQKEWNACHTRLGLERKKGDGVGTIDFSFSFQTTFSFRLALMPLFSWETATCSGL